MNEYKKTETDFTKHRIIKKREKKAEKEKGMFNSPTQLFRCFRKIVSTFLQVIEKDPIKGNPSCCNH